MFRSLPVERYGSDFEEGCKLLMCLRYSQPQSPTLVMLEFDWNVTRRRL